MKSPCIIRHKRKNRRISSTDYLLEIFHLLLKLLLPKLYTVRYRYIFHRFTPFSFHSACFIYCDYTALYNFAVIITTKKTPLWFLMKPQGYLPFKSHVKSDKFPFLIRNNLNIYLIVFVFQFLLDLIPDTMQNADMYDICFISNIYFVISS